MKLVDIKAGLPTIPPQPAPQLLLELLDSRKLLKNCLCRQSRRKDPSESSPFSPLSSLRMPGTGAGGKQVTKPMLNP